MTDFIPAYLPYFAFALVVGFGCWKKNMVSVWAGILFLLFYDPKPEMEIIAKTRVCLNCNCNIERGVK